MITAARTPKYQPIVWVGKASEVWGIYQAQNSMNFIYCLLKCSTAKQYRNVSLECLLSSNSQSYLYLSFHLFHIFLPCNWCYPLMEHLTTSQPFYPPLLWFRTRTIFLLFFFQFINSVCYFHGLRNIRSLKTHPLEPGQTSNGRFKGFASLMFLRCFQFSREWWIPNMQLHGNIKLVATTNQVPNNVFSIVKYQTSIT